MEARDWKSDGNLSGNPMSIVVIYDNDAIMYAYEKLNQTRLANRRKEA